jgi:sulfur transfer complex TusBCD TusB component (DsrH family)
MLYGLVHLFENTVIKAAEQSQLPPVIIAQILEKLALKIDLQARMISENARGTTSRSGGGGEPGEPK